MTSFVSNMVTNLHISKYGQCDPIAGNVDDPIIKTIVKYKNGPNIFAKGEYVTEENKFSLFSQK